jgi:thiamine-phosphate pyrophosphorylase
VGRPIKIQSQRGAKIHYGRTSVLRRVEPKAREPVLRLGTRQAKYLAEDGDSEKSHLAFGGTARDADGAASLLSYHPADLQHGSLSGALWRVDGGVRRDGIACLVADDPQFCVRVHADGVHVNGEGPQLEQALRSLKPGLIVGAGGLRTRHAAMVAGEAGVDYVMFGEGAEQQATLVEQIAWWAEIFTVPCVGYAHDLDSIGDLVCAGADFIALGGAVFSDPRGPEAALHVAAALVTRAPEAAR